jgi:hypothetical protein
MRGISAKVIAACFTLAAFAVAVVAGLASDNPATHVLVRAVVAMCVCYPVGYVAGMVCERVISAHIESHKQANPAPDPMSGAGTAPGHPAEEGDEVIVV